MDCCGSIWQIEVVLYTAYEAHGVLFNPVRTAARLTVNGLDAVPGLPLRRVRAFNEVIAAATLTHTRPEFGIDSVLVDGERVPVREEAPLVTPFGTLLHFVKEVSMPQPAVLLVVPLSGHFATMLRATVRSLLADHDVFVTDWHNARDVSLDEGAFGFDDYVEHLIRFIRFIGPGTHVMAVCQPCPSALIATAVLAQADDPAQPRSLTLMSGPIDARVNPTKINDMASRRTIDWYRKHCIARVPNKWAGAGRRVYPGFLQVSAFMSMNARRHLNSHVQLYRDYAAERLVAAASARDFYREYFAVLDMPEEFYLETVSSVFQEHRLARGEMSYEERLVEPAAISRTPILTIEAANDDMCAPGQTDAAHDLTTGLRSDQRARHLQAGVGHYGIFAGRRWESEVYPVVRDFIARCP